MANKGTSTFSRFLWRFTLCAAVSSLVWMSVPRAGLSFAENVQDYMHLTGHMLGLLGRHRYAKYGQIASPNPRASNGTIPEVEGWVDRKTFVEKYRGNGPVVFRGAATRANGWNIECFTEGGTLPDVFRREIGNKTVRVFRDEYDDASADWMPFAEYERLVAAVRANKSTKMPYARSLPVMTLDKCSMPIPEETLQGYHAPWSLTKLSKSLRQTFVFFSLLQGTTTKLHIDAGDSFFTQVYGRKRWLLIDPKYATQLKIYGDTMNLVYMSGYDVWQEEIPPHIPVKEVILHPGDVLYFPSMTFHGVQNLDPITMGIDEVGVDLVLSMTRHWPLTLGTVLNPWLAIKSMQQLWRTGTLNGYELYFEGFSANVLKETPNAKLGQEL